MKIEIKTLKDLIGYLKKELNNTDFSSKKALEINARKLDKKIYEREEDLERRY